VDACGELIDQADVVALLAIFFAAYRWIKGGRGESELVPYFVRKKRGTTMDWFKGNFAGKPHI
jgi:hypothetical protein